jgi:Glyoxalase/Bleomycin resistance protein/Dioxygenase superfamily
MNALQQRQNQLPVKISGIDHLTLPVHDLDLAERFYTQVLGAKVMFRTERSRTMPFIAITIGSSPSISATLGTARRKSAQSPSCVCSQGRRLAGTQTVANRSPDSRCRPHSLWPSRSWIALFSRSIWQPSRIVCDGFYG